VWQHKDAARRGPTPIQTLPPTGDDCPGHDGRPKAMRATRDDRMEQDERLPRMSDSRRAAANRRANNPTSEEEGASRLQLPRRNLADWGVRPLDRSGCRWCAACGQSYFAICQELDSSHRTNDPAPRGFVESVDDEQLSGQPFSRYLPRNREYNAVPRPSILVRPGAGRRSDGPHTGRIA